MHGARLVRSVIAGKVENVLADIGKAGGLGGEFPDDDGCPSQVAKCVEIGVAGSTAGKGDRLDVDVGGMEIFFGHVFLERFPK